MKYSHALVWPLLFILVTGSACSTGSPEIPAAPVTQATVTSSFEDTWQATRRALLGAGYELYTRDKRGLFVARTKMKRRFLTPIRTEFVITLEETTPEETLVTVETNAQKYSVTLLTYPGWKNTAREVDPQAADGILEGIRNELAAGAGTVAES